jgi:hypothetical protein
VPSLDDEEPPPPEQPMSEPTKTRASSLAPVFAMGPTVIDFSSIFSS